MVVLTEVQNLRLVQAFETLLEIAWDAVEGVFLYEVQVFRGKSNFHQFCRAYNLLL